MGKRHSTRGQREKLPRGAYEYEELDVDVERVAAEWTKDRKSFEASFSRQLLVGLVALAGFIVTGIFAWKEAYALAATTLVVMTLIVGLLHVGNKTAARRNGRGPPRGG